MPGFHAALGWGVVGGFLLMWLWGTGAGLLRREAGAWFWRLVAILQVTLIVQVAVGIALLAIGGRQPLLHYAYGGPFPAIALGVAHARARASPPPRGAQWVFGWAAFFAWGLTTRALMLGLGVGV